MNYRIELSIIKITVTIILILLLFAFPKQEKVSADAAPEPGAVASNLSSNLNQTKVRMEAETIVISIPENSDYWSGHAIVTATFYMRNMGDEIEEMKARFPMNMSNYNYGYEVKNGIEYCTYKSNFPSIDELSVFIDNEQVNISTTQNDIDLHELLGAPEGTIRHIKCWAHFDVIFPPDEQVIIQIQYKVAGYKSQTRYVDYKYILQTGQGWFDTIGSADIVVSLPYEVKPINTIYCRPSDCTFIDNTIQWHFDDFEPQENIEFELIDPSIWSRIIREEANVEKYPEDGEAWGRLGKAYKEAATESKGFISIANDPNFFQMSMDAYQKALLLNPDDIDWHYGYAELMCIASMIQYHNQDDNRQMILSECNKHLKYALDRNPNHEEALYLLEWTRNQTRNYSTDEIAEYLILTPMASRTFTSTPITSTITIEPSITSTPLPSHTSSPTKTETVITTSPTPTAKSTHSPNAQQNRLLFAVGVNILFIMLFFLVIRSDQPKK